MKDRCRKGSGRIGVGRLDGRPLELLVDLRLDAAQREVGGLGFDRAHRLSVELGLAQPKPGVLSSRGVATLALLLGLSGFGSLASSSVH
jgi:hypothetical protein